VVCLFGGKAVEIEKWQMLLATHQADMLAAAGFGEFQAAGQKGFEAGWVRGQNDLRASWPKKRCGRHGAVKREA
jgi:hypothetical protein